ncbi:MAG TPA: hypothetical protein VJ787_12005, partial [Thermoleophilia bacterium]|nr:hypothetical protein [Thermoleophilia bacterium]
GAAVVAVARDSDFGTREQAHEQTAYLARLAGMQDRVTFVGSRLQAPLDGIDIVTDVAGVRPIDEGVIRGLRDTAVVTLMSAVTGWHPSEVDAVGCRRAGIAIAGVDEDGIDLHRYEALRIAWFLLELGVEIVGSTLLFAADGIVYPKVARVFAQMGARVLVAGPDGPGRVSLHGAEKVGGDLGDTEVRRLLREADALLTFTDQPDKDLVGASAAISATELAALAPHLAVAVHSGKVDRHALAEAGLRVFPETDAGGGHATHAIGELVPQPIIELHTAGLRVGEVMARARRRGSSPLAAEELAAGIAHGDLFPKELPQAYRRPV